MALGKNEDSRNQKYQYFLATEGRCVGKHKHEKDNPFGFVKGEPIPRGDPQTYKELVENWREIFVLDDLIVNDESGNGAKSYSFIDC